MVLRFMRSFQKPLDMSPPALLWAPPNAHAEAEDDEKEEADDGPALRPYRGTAAGAGEALNPDRGTMTGDPVLPSMSIPKATGCGCGKV